MSEGILNPAGPVAAGEKIILLDSLAIMLAIIIPVIIATLLFAWWFRSSNNKSKYLPDWSYSGRIELVVWSIPALVVIFVGGIGWIGSHLLDPAKPLVSNKKPLEIEVVALDWKWLFVYPRQHIASINCLVAPIGVPLHLRLTSASVFNVFFVPRIGSEIYAMNGMATELYLQADKPGSYPGLAAHFNGDGFPDMDFSFDAMPDVDFSAWIAQSKSHGPVLDDAEYRTLLRQTANIQPYTYSYVQPDLFDAVVRHELPRDEEATITKPGKEE